MSMKKNMYGLCEDLFPINRSITGDGVRETLDIIKSYLPELQVTEVPSGTKCFDWEIPREWKIRDAYIIDPTGKKIADFKKNNLHVVGYSVAVDQEMSLDELRPKLFSKPDLPDAIPYYTSYYKEDWGFCISENEKKQLVLKKEREIAGEVQKKLFPIEKNIENFVYAKNVPARDVSGDYFDVVRSTPEEYFFTLADVSGKGIKAGMYMAKASSIFRTLTNLKFPLEKVVFGVNNELVEAKFKGMFVTAVFGKLNIKTGELVFINAGHESILTFDENKNYEYIKSEMPPIGIVKYFTESMVKSNTINLKDKTFVVYTDGVTEGYMKNGEELGAEGVQKIINEMSQVTPKSIVEAIEKELNWGAEKLRDDITCMAININNTELIKKK